MLAARAIRKKKSKTEQEKKDLPRGPYIKPFGPRFDSSELPYFKYGVATQNCTLEMELLCNSLAHNGGKNLLISFFPFSKNVEILTFGIG